MNGQTHIDYAMATYRFLLVKGDLAQLVVAADADEFAAAAARPDKVDEVACGGRVELLGHNLSSFQHFQIKGGGGYLLSRDPSLTLIGELAAPIAELAGLVVAPNAAGERPPLSGLPEDSPMQLQAAMQPGRALGTFWFPSAADGAGYYARAATGWLARANTTGWRACAGYAIHFVQDCCVPHHAWGALRFGHSDWEDQLQSAWAETWQEVAGEDAFKTLLAPAVEREIRDFELFAGVGDLCEVNAEWSRRIFGTPHVLETCPGDVALRVSVRAIASSVIACRIMGCPF